MLDQGEQQVQLSRQVRRSSGVGAFQALVAPKWPESDGVKGNRHDLWTQAGATSARRCRLVLDVRCEHWHPSRRMSRTHEAPRPAVGAAVRRPQRGTAACGARGWQAGKITVGADTV